MGILGGRPMTGDNLQMDDDEAFQDMVETVYPGLEIKDHYHYKDLVHGFNVDTGLDRNLDVMWKLKELITGYKAIIENERDYGVSNEK